MKRKKKKVVISISGGLVDVVKMSKGIKLEIRDYDAVKDIKDGEKVDGVEYIKTVLTKKDALVNK